MTASYSYDITDGGRAPTSATATAAATRIPTDAQSHAVFFQIGRTFETIPNAAWH